MKVIIKGVNYTEVRTTSKRDGQETVQYWVLEKLRKPENCGVWRDGKKTAGYEDMDKSPLVRKVPIDFSRKETAK